MTLREICTWTPDMMGPCDECERTGKKARHVFRFPDGQVWRIRGNEDCDNCGGRGKLELSSIIADKQDKRTVDEIVKVMVACSEEDDPSILERANHLHAILWAVRDRVEERYPEELSYFFPETTLESLRLVEERLATKLRK